MFFYNLELHWLENNPLIKQLTTGNKKHEGFIFLH